MRYFAFIIVLLTACSFPKDPENSLQEARQQGLRVGIVNNPPYTTCQDGSAGGTEAGIINRFAQSENLKVTYVYGTESVLMPQLEKYNLHLIIGGFNKKTVWKDKAGLTTTYNGNNCFLIAKGENDLLYRLESYLLKQKQYGN